MPSIDKAFLHQLKDDYSKYHCFIETGTFTGNTINAMEPYFKELHTIEVSETYYNRAKNRFNHTNINCILGDSSNVFQTLLPTINTNTIFFLDGHYSSGDTGKGEKDCPLIEEISHINNLFKHEAIIIIDDYRLFGKSPASGCNEDWSIINKNTLIQILQSRIKDVYHLPSDLATDDRLIIHIQAQP